MFKGLVFIIGCILFLLAIVSAVMVFFKMPFENLRKIFHFVFIIAATIWLYAFDDWKTSAITMFVFMLLAYPILCAFEKIPFLVKHLPQRKKGEFKQSLIAAASMYIIVVAIGWGLMKNRSLSLAAIYAWGPGDGTAALIGKRYGRHKIGKQKKKSLEGSASMFVLSFVCIASILIYNNVFTLTQSLLVSFITALVTTYVELIVLSVYDTFFCPVAAIIVLSIFKYFLG